MRVPSSDHVNVAVHEFGGSGRPLLLAHATGFHGYAYLPVADLLSEEFESFALDYRGHGSTARPHDWQVDWTRYGDDALAAARAVAALTEDDRGLVGYGHSMGATGLLMAAHRDPDLFDVIVAFEPIVFPPRETGRGDDPSMMVAGARRRRATFESFEAAIEHYGSKPPLDRFDPGVLRLYVGHGFAPSPEGVRLKCDPEHEARTFEQGGRHRTWDVLPNIHTRVVVVSGDIEEYGPAAIARPVSERLPNATYIEIPTADHFGPFVDPAEHARLIRVAAAGDTATS